MSGTDACADGPAAEGLVLARSERHGARRLPRTKDRNAESFWVQQDNVMLVCKVKADYPTWGRRRLVDYIADQHGITLTEQRVRQCRSTFFF